jgi:hypothetical protein
MTHADTVTIRPMKPEDFEAWLPIWNSYLWENRTKMRWVDRVALFKTLTKWVRDAGALIAVHGDEIVGLVQYRIRRSEFEFETAFCIEDVFVLPEHETKTLKVSLISAVYDHSWAQKAPIVLWKSAELLLTGTENAEAAAASPFLNFKKAA